jgi:OOP family OmpA-OmpF porin
MNQDLSRRRAIAVREYLLSNMAISADRISAVGYGESRPVAPNDTERGRTQNRRIDVTLSLDQ